MPKHVVALPLLFFACDHNLGQLCETDDDCVGLTDECVTVFEDLDPDTGPYSFCTRTCEDTDECEARLGYGAICGTAYFDESGPVRYCFLTCDWERACPPEHHCEQMFETTMHTGCAVWEGE